MSTNYYIKKNKPYLSSIESEEIEKAYQTIYATLMQLVKSPNINIKQWANEQLSNLEDSTLKNNYDKVHIGKNSFGNRFTLKATHNTWKEWKKYLIQTESVIVDEYGYNVSIQELDTLVKDSMKNPVNFKDQTLSSDGLYLMDQNFC
jgi:S-adenosylmethionine:tRNA-ribosyltransferase-isomerase (queuine synthetase)